MITVPGGREWRIKDLTESERWASVMSSTEISAASLKWAMVPSCCVLGCRGLHWGSRFKGEDFTGKETTIMQGHHQVIFKVGFWREQKVKGLSERRWGRCYTGVNGVSIHPWSTEWTVLYLLQWELFLLSKSFCSKGNRSSSCNSDKFFWMWVQYECVLPSPSTRYFPRTTTSLVFWAWAMYWAWSSISSQVWPCSEWGIG